MGSSQESSAGHLPQIHSTAAAWVSTPRRVSPGSVSRVRIVYTEERISRVGAALVMMCCNRFRHATSWGASSTARASAILAAVAEALGCDLMVRLLAGPDLCTRCGASPRRLPGVRTRFSEDSCPTDPTVPQSSVGP